MPMKVKRCLLSGNMLSSLDDVYNELARQLSLPSYFGRNLDALWDVLSTDIKGPFEIVWQQAAASRQAMGKEYGRIIKVLRRLEKERDDFSLIVEQ